MENKNTMRLLAISAILLSTISIALNIQQRLESNKQKISEPGFSKREIITLIESYSILEGSNDEALVEIAKSNIYRVTGRDAVFSGDALYILNPDKKRK